MCSPMIVQRKTLHFHSTGICHAASATRLSPTSAILIIIACEPQTILLAFGGIKQKLANICSNDRCPTQIVTDKLRFRQILMKLISNAIKFTGRGGKVSVRVAHGRVCFIPEQEATAESVVADGHVDDAGHVADARSRSGGGCKKKKREEGTMAVEDMFWRRRHGGEGVSQKKEGRRGMNLDLNERRAVTFPELKVAEWKGENKHFNLDECQEHTDDQEKKCKGDPSEYVHIVVKDSGRGIPATLQKTIFDPFVQVYEHPFIGSLVLAVIWLTVMCKEALKAITFRLLVAEPCTQAHPLFPSQATKACTIINLSLSSLWLNWLLASAKVP